MIHSPRLLLALAAGAIGFAAADTYVVVMALPEMMSSAGLSVEQLQRAAPIISGFLLGYVAILPLIGRISDIAGRVPVVTVCLLLFALGSLFTAVAYDLNTMVFGRFVQGIGGGGLVPPTLALVADVWPPHRRGLPLGMVGAVQELGSVLGPLFGAAVLAVADWRAIFWINCAVGLVIAAATTHWRSTSVRRSHTDWLGIAIAIGLITVISLIMIAPEPLVSGLTTGLAYVPVLGESRWATPLATCAYGLTALLSLRLWTAAYPLIDVRALPRMAREIDVVGAGALAVSLGCIVVAFASAEPEKYAISTQAWWLLPIAVLAGAGFIWRQASAVHPLIPRGALRERPAWGAVLVSFFIGAALIAALVDIPLFARLTKFPDSQLDAALVLVRFLVALPIGALLGGALTRRIAPALLTSVAMLLCVAGFVPMTMWAHDALDSPTSSVALIVTGFGFGLAIAPLNATLLDHTEDAVHGLVSGLLVVARMVGMLIGISALTTIGLRRFYAVESNIPTIAELCGPQANVCSAYKSAVRDAGLAQLHTVFAGAAVCAGIAAGLALVLLSDHRHQGVTVKK